MGYRWLWMGLAGVVASPAWGQECEVVEPVPGCVYFDQILPECISEADLVDGAPDLCASHGGEVLDLAVCSAGCPEGQVGHYSLNCCQAPTCEAGGPYLVTCPGHQDATDVSLDASDSTDPDGGALAFAWSTDCPGPFDSSGPQPVLTLDTSVACALECSLALEVTDDEGITATCGTTLTATGPDLDDLVLYHFFGEASYRVSAVALADLDGDGFADVIVSTTNTSAQGLQEGLLYVFSGADGTVLHALSAPDGDGWYPAALATPGDLDGDGYDDFLVGDFVDGRVDLFSGFDGALIDTLDGEAADDQFGQVVATSPDLDGDGVPEILVGAPLGGPALVGRAYVFSGATGSELLRFEGAPPDPGLVRNFGYALAGPGDLNGDGVPDVLVTETSYPHPYPGAVFAYSGADGTLLYEVAGDRFGYSLAAVGDVDGDGVGDFAVGSPSLDDGTGSVTVFSGVDGEELYTLDGRGPQTSFGNNLGTTDLDGDGVLELLVAAPAGIAAVPSGQRVHAFSVDDGSLRVSLSGPTWFGNAVGGGADVSGDGVDDWVIGGGTPGLAGIPEIFVYTLDAQRRPVAVCADATASAGPTCTACAAVDAGSYDPNGDPLVLTQAPDCDYGLGLTEVSLTASDGDLVATCTATVEVQDTTGPAIAFEARNLPANELPAHFDLTATDNCDVVTPQVSVVCLYDPGTGNQLGDCPWSWADGVFSLLDHPGEGTLIAVQVAATDTSGNRASAAYILQVTAPVEPTSPCDGLVPTRVGTAGPDLIFGSWGNDVIVAGDGDDFVFALHGSDIVCGEGGNDLLWGGTGDDVLAGGEGDDWLLGSFGYDVLDGGEGEDVCADPWGAEEAIDCECTW